MFLRSRVFCLSCHSQHTKNKHIYTVKDETIKKCKRWHTFLRSRVVCVGCNVTYACKSSKQGVLQLQESTQLEVRDSVSSIRYQSDVAGLGLEPCFGGEIFHNTLHVHCANDMRDLSIEVRDGNDQVHH